MLNNQIFFILYSLSHKSVFFDKLAVFITDPLIYIMIFVVSIYFLIDINDLHRRIDFNFIKEKIKIFIPVLITGILSWGMADLLKSIFKIDRPFVKFSQVVTLVPESGFSFPSLHATLITALAFAVYFKKKRFGYVCLFIALIIGISRVVVGVHYPLDVISGFILGFLVAFLVHEFMVDFWDKKL